MKRLVLAALILTTAVGASAQFTSTDTLKYRISLTDKAATTYSIQQPEEFLSRKSIDRRLRQKLAIDSTDLPVCKKDRKSGRVGKECRSRWSPYH